MGGYLLSIQSWDNVSGSGTRRKYSGKAWREKLRIIREANRKEKTGSEIVEAYGIPQWTLYIAKRNQNVIISCRQRIITERKWIWELKHLHYEEEVFGCGISWLPQQLLASQEMLFSMELVIIRIVLVCLYY